MAYNKTMGENGGPGLQPFQPTRLQPRDAVYMLQDEPRGPSQIIEVPVTAAATAKIVLPVIQNLQNQVDVNVILKALRVIPPTVLAIAPTVGGANAPLTELQKMSLVLYSEEWEKGQLIPLLTLVDTFTEGSGIPWRTRTTRFDSWRNVNWGKSFIQFSSGTLPVGAPYTVVLEAEYQKFNEFGIEIVGPR